MKKLFSKLFTKEKEPDEKVVPFAATPAQKLEQSDTEAIKTFRDAVIRVTTAEQDVLMNKVFPANHSVREIASESLQGNEVPYLTDIRVLRSSGQTNVDILPKQHLASFYRYSHKDRQLSVHYKRVSTFSPPTGELIGGFTEDFMLVEKDLKYSTVFQTTADGRRYVRFYVGNAANYTEIHLPSSDYPDSAAVYTRDSGFFLYKVSADGVGLQVSTGKLGVYTSRSYDYVFTCDGSEILWFSRKDGSNIPVSNDAIPFKWHLDKERNEIHLPSDRVLPLHLSIQDFSFTSLMGADIADTILQTPQLPEFD